MTLIKEKISKFNNSNLIWNTPKSRNFAELSDPSLFEEVLRIAYHNGNVSLPMLISSKNGLRQRLKRLQVVEAPTKTNIIGLLSALQKFGWLKNIKYKPGILILTEDGYSVLNRITNNKSIFLRILAEKMHERYVIPGWIISRLLDLNIARQGEIVLPSPLKSWQPKKRKWEDFDWSAELSQQVTLTAERANKVFPGSFPTENTIWQKEVREAWMRLSTVKQKKVSKSKELNSSSPEKPKIATFSPRGRLAIAMRDAAINLLFSERCPGKEYPDFQLGKHPIPPRAFRAWIPKLEVLELIFYTDSHPLVSGKLIVPCGAFREKAKSPPFEKINKIKDPLDRSLWLFQPSWRYIKKDFIDSLLNTYRMISKSIGSLYVNLLDLRDEVCRQLRLSTLLFDKLIETAYREAVTENLLSGKKISISLESDIRPEQLSAYGLLRRPVYIDNVPHSLIAISTSK